VVKRTLKNLKVFREGFPFRSRSTLAVDLPNFAYPSEKGTISPLEFVLLDASSMKKMINNDYIFEISLKDFNEVEKLDLIKWKETRSLFKIVESRS
jgi:hypothetical protein